MRAPATAEQITYHPRLGQVEALWEELKSRAPKAARHDGELNGDIALYVVDVPIPIRWIEDIALPVKLVDEYTIDEIAFGLAYAAVLSPVLNFVEDSVTPMMKFTGWVDSTFSSPVAHVLSMPASMMLSAAGGPYGLWLAVTEFAPREREAIELAVRWVHDCGYDPKAGVSLFAKASGWMDRASTEDKPEPSLSDKIAAYSTMAVAAPFFGAAAAKIKDDTPMVSAAERAEVVQEACDRLLG